MSDLVSYYDGWEPTGTYFAGKAERGKWIKVTAEERDRREKNLDEYIAKMEKLEDKIKRLRKKGPKR